MDMLMVDLGTMEDAVGVGLGVAVRDTAVLWGPGEMNAGDCGDG